LTLLNKKHPWTKCCTGRFLSEKGGVMIYATENKSLNFAPVVWVRGKNIYADFRDI